MYGDEASKLAREAKRTVDHFPPYNDSLVRSITREVKHLHETCQALIREFRMLEVQLHQEAEQIMAANATAAAMAEPSSSAQTTVAGSLLSSGEQQSTVILSSSLRSEAELRNEMQRQTQVFWTKYLVHYVPMQRNKRILMAYHHQRLEKIKEIAWAFNSLPDQTARLLSPDERIFFDEYERNRNRYLSAFGEIELGLGMMVPPKDVFITVRVLKDCGDIVTESGATLSLKKNSEHFVKRGDVEGLITQGYLLHVA